MERASRSIAAILGRALKLKCPACARATIVEKPFHLKQCCTSCGVIFKREEGFFVGAIMANVVATEILILLVYFALLATGLSDGVTFTILFAVAAGFPLAFYHHSWSFWLGIDHLIEGLPPGELAGRRNSLRRQRF